MTLSALLLGPLISIVRTVLYYSEVRTRTVKTRSVQYVE